MPFSPASVGIQMLAWAAEVGVALSTPCCVGGFFEAVDRSPWHGLAAAVLVAASCSSCRMRPLRRSISLGGLSAVSA